MITYKYRCWISYEHEEVTDPDYLDGVGTKDFVKNEISLFPGFLKEALRDHKLNEEACTLKSFSYVGNCWEMVFHTHISQAKFDAVLSQARDKMNEDLGSYSGFNEAQGIRLLDTAYLGTTTGAKCAHDYVHKQYLPVGDKIYSILECTICGNPTKRVVK